MVNPMTQNLWTKATDNRKNPPIRTTKRRSPKRDFRGATSGVELNRPKRTVDTKLQNLHLGMSPSFRDAPQVLNPGTVVIAEQSHCPDGQ